MIRFNQLRDEMEALIEELLSKTPEEGRCPFLKKDETGMYCSKNLKPNEPIEEQRRDICDAYSLQLWCLDKKRAGKCIWYQGEIFREEK